MLLRQKSEIISISYYKIAIHFNKRKFSVEHDVEFKAIQNDQNLELISGYTSSTVDDIH